MAITLGSSTVSACLLPIYSVSPQNRYLLGSSTPFLESVIWVVAHTVLLEQSLHAELSLDRPVLKRMGIWEPDAPV